MQTSPKLRCTNDYRPMLVTQQNDHKRSKMCPYILFPQQKAPTKSPDKKHQHLDTPGHLKNIQSGLVCASHATTRFCDQSQLTLHKTSCVYMHKKSSDLSKADLKNFNKIERHHAPASCTCHWSRFDFVKLNQGTTAIIRCQCYSA
jgi:hypothetical protein